jgi:hypothetical protein
MPVSRVSGIGSGSIKSMVQRRHRRIDSQSESQVPSNQGMQLTIKSVTPFAFVKVAPLLLAADPRC